MIRFDISEAEEFGRELGISIEKAAKRAILATANKVVQRATTVVIPAEPRPPVDRRVYAAGFRARPDPQGAIVSNNVPWAGVIEDGARAENVKIGRKMIDALTEWVIRKQLIGTASGKKAREDARAAARQVAWAIATSLKQKGIFAEGKGLKILAKALKGVDRDFAEELRREIDRATR